MKITEFRAENFKKLTAVEIRPDGSLIVVGGKNAAGKSSCLDAIEAALGGGKRAPEEPVRRGAKSARIVVETGEYTITRRFSGRSSSLEIKSADGSTCASPQALLDRLIGPISFDPLAFARMAPRDQAETLRRLVGVDTSALEAERARAYDERTQHTRELARLQGALARLPAPVADTPAEEISITALASDIQESQSVIAAHTAQRGALAQAERREAAALDDVSRAAAKIDRIQRDLEVARAEHIAATEKMDEASAARGRLAKDVAALVDPDLAPIRAKLAGAEGINRAVRARAEREKLSSELAAEKSTADKLTRQLESCDERKAAVIAGAKYPIDGLTVDDRGVLYGGIPFAQCSHAEQLRVSVAIGLALNPELKVLLVRDGSLLDADGLAAIGEMSEKAGAQVWVERVGTGKECSVVIDDGHVVEEERS